MTASDFSSFLDRVRQAGIHLWLDGDRLGYRGARAALTPDVLAEIAARRPELVAFLRDARASSADGAERIPPVPRDQPLPLSFAQGRMWFLHRFGSDRGTYNVPIRIDPRLVANVHVAQQAVFEVGRRHEVLRTTYGLVGAEPTQHVASRLSTMLKVADLTQLRARHAAAVARRLGREEALRPFILEREPVLRLAVFRSPAQRHAALCTIHHIATDGWSIQVLTRELREHVQAFRGGCPSLLPALDIQYADYAVWQRRRVRGAWLEEQLAWWQRQLEGSGEVLELPLDRPRPLVPSHRGATLSLALPDDLTAQLHGLSQRVGATLFMTVLASLQLLLARYGRTDSVTVGIGVTGRTIPQLEPLVGLFVNSLALRTTIPWRGTFADLVQDVRQRTLDAYAHQEVPFDKVVERLRPLRTSSHTPLFQVACLMGEDANVPSGISGSQRSDQGVAEATLAKFDLILVMATQGKGLAVEFQYNTDVFEAITIQRLAASWQTLIASVFVSPNATLRELPILPADERTTLISSWNDTGKDLDGLLPAGLTRAESAFPDSIAAVAGEQHVSYRQLHHRAARLAAALRRLGVGQETLVALCLELSPELLLAVLAVWKAGGAYVPIDSAWPVARQRDVLEDSRPAVVIGRHASSAQLRIDETPFIAVEDWLGPGDRMPPRPTYSDDGDAALAVIYTSGSTGRPKGVITTHRGIANVLAWIRQHCDLGTTDRVLWHTSLTFDPSLFEFGPALAVGATVVIQSSTPDRVATLETCRREQITVCNAVPSLLEEWVVRAGAGGGASVRHVMTGGEALRTEIVERWLSATPSSLHHAYGPTETSIAVAAGTCARGWSRPVAAVGRQLPNTRFTVLEEATGHVAPIGLAGRLMIGGAGVARGYLRQPAATAERFVPDFASPLPGARCYDSGNRVRYLQDGALEFVGRADDQVKIRGMRIEPREVEAAMRDHSEVLDAAVVAHERGGNKVLVGYWVPREGRDLDPGALRMQLEARLPHGFVPTQLIALEQMPRTVGGKIDRARLPAPGNERPNVGAFIAPRTTIERILADVWAQVLDLDRVGIRDNFFVLGGHSLSAARMMAHLEQRLGRQVPLATLFSSPTIADMVAAIDSPAETLPWSPLVRIQRGNAQRLPLFCVHPVGGNVLCYRDLARCLGPEQPVYGLQAPELVDVEGAAPSIEGMAAHYINAMFEGLPHRGPVMLLGWSFGGMVAFEMARQIQERGLPVGLLAILDTLPPKLTTKLFRDDDRVLLVEYGREEAHRRGVPLPFTLSEVREVAIDDLPGFLVSRMQARQLIPAGIDAATWFTNLQRLMTGFRTRTSAAFRYDPRPYSGLITLVRSSELDSDAAEHWRSAGVDHGNRSLGWEALSTEPVEVHFIRGHHETLCMPPYVDEVAAVLSRYCSRVESPQVEVV